MQFLKKIQPWQIVCLILVITIATLYQVFTQQEQHEQAFDHYFSQLPAKPTEDYYDYARVLNSDTKQLLQQVNDFYAQQAKQPRVILVTADGFKEDEVYQRLKQRWQLDNNAGKQTVVVVYCANHGTQSLQLEVGSELKKGFRNADLQTIYDGDTADVNSVQQAKINDGLYKAVAVTSSLIDSAEGIQDNPIKSQILPSGENRIGLQTFNNTQASAVTTQVDAKRRKEIFDQLDEISMRAYVRQHKEL